MTENTPTHIQHSEFDQVCTLVTVIIWSAIHCDWKVLICPNSCIGSLCTDIRKYVLIYLFIEL